MYGLLLASRSSILCRAKGVSMSTLCLNLLQTTKFPSSLVSTIPLFRFSPVICACVVSLAKKSRKRTRITNNSKEFAPFL